MAHHLTSQNPLGMEGKMMLRGAGISLGAVVVVYGLAGCSSIFGPDKDDEKEGRFGIGNSSSFVTTGGASGDIPDDITFIVDLFTQRMSFNAKGGGTASGVFNFTGKVLGFDTHIHGDIVCYTINGNQARVAGHNTSYDPPQDRDNDAVWVVEDTGEGSSPPGTSTPDRISLYATVPHVLPPLDPNYNCLTATALEGTMYPIETGNVQIHN